MRKLKPKGYLVEWYGEACYSYFPGMAYAQLKVGEVVAGGYDDAKITLLYAEQPITEEKTGIQDGDIGPVDTIGISTPITTEGKLAAISEALDRCNAALPSYQVDAMYDFIDAVEGILGEK